MIRRQSQVDLGDLPRPQLQTSGEKVHDEGDAGGSTFSELLYTNNQILPPRDFSIDPNYGTELIELVETATIFPNMTNFTLEEMVEDMLVALLEQQSDYYKDHQNYEKGVVGDKSGNRGSELELDEDAVYADDQGEQLRDTRAEFTVELAMNSIFVSETVSNLTKCIQKTQFNDFDGIYYDDHWLIVLCELQSIKRRKVVIARMTYEMYMMPTCQAARCVLLILANSEERGMKSAVQTGASFGTILSLPNFVQDLTRLETPREIVAHFIRHIDQLKEEGANIESLALARGFMHKEKFAIARPLTGVIAELKHRIPFYLSDFSDGLTGYKTKQKLLTAVVFQYFATVLPVIVLGHNVNKLTESHLSTKTILYSQFFGSILYGIFSGNPMMMFQVSSVILLYAQVLFEFSTNNDHNFYLMFGLTGFFSGIILMLLGILNIGSLMIFSTASVADMVDVFQTITFCQSVSFDLISQYNTVYMCEKVSECAPATFVLNILILFLTIIIAEKFRGIREMRVMTIAVRDFLSDMGIPFGVIGTTIIASFMFYDIELTPFTYNVDENPFHLLSSQSMKASSVIMCFVLSVPLAMLIFLDHNLNGEFLGDPSTKLYKGRALHFDMLVVGSINAILGFFGMSSMQGIFPNTPLHIKQMGDVEVTWDQGIAVKTLIRVRDTRLTQLIVGILIGASTLLLPYPISYIPKTALDGLLLVIGFVSLEDNKLVERLRLFVADQSAFPSDSPIRKVPVSVSNKFSALQIFQLAIISFISFSNISFLSVLFPVALGLLIPARVFLIPKLFEHKHLELLDPLKVEFASKGSQKK